MANGTCTRALELEKANSVCPGDPAKMVKRDILESDKCILNGEVPAICLPEFQKEFAER